MMDKDKLFQKFFRDYRAPFFYKKIVVSADQEVYYKNGKLVVLVEKELGRKIYDVVSYLADTKNKIFTPQMDFEITRYYEGSYATIVAFEAKIKWHFERRWNALTSIEKLQELVAFTEEMYKIGYVLKESKFENRTCDQIASFLSFFEPEGEVAVSYKGCLLKYIHYRLCQDSIDRVTKICAGGVVLEQYYREFSNGKTLLKVGEFPYELPLINACYSYYQTGMVEGDLQELLRLEAKAQWCCNYYESCYVIDSQTLKKSRTILESTPNYTTYLGNIRVYHSMPEGLAEFLKDCQHNETEMPIGTVLVNLQGNIIGYSFEDGEKGIQVDNFEKSGVAILSSFSEIITYVLTLNEKLEYSVKKQEIDLDLAKAIRNHQGSSFKVRSIEDLYAIACAKREDLELKLTTWFFEVYGSYLNEKYGKMDTEIQLLEKAEIRYISPILAKELMNCILGKPVNYELATKELQQFLKSKIRGYSAYYYDQRFAYNPEEVPVHFDYEVEKQYGVELEKKQRQVLSDGRQLIILSRATTALALKQKEEKRLKELEEKFKSFFRMNEFIMNRCIVGGVTTVKAVTISKIIYSRELNSNGMYKVVGYVTTPLKGNLLTQEVMLSLDNRQLYFVLGHLSMLFDRYYISGNSIWIDEDFTIYINLLNKDFQIQKVPEYYASFAECVKAYLVEQGYNSNAFCNISFSTAYEWISYAKKCDAYCEEHCLYYPSDNGVCPVCSLTKVHVLDRDIPLLMKLEEDNVAVHYRLNDAYNLKVYKDTCPDRERVMANVLKIIEARVEGNEINLGQECFVPHKKLLNDKQECIGYVYRAILFGEADTGSCIDLTDPKQWKNLSRLKSLIRLIMQVKDLMSRGLSFIQNPFNHVYLSKEHKGQVQILNPDFISREGANKKTTKWVYQYVKAVIKADSGIELDFPNDHENLETLLRRMQKLAGELTAYCDIHNMYYKAERRFCPKCIKETDLQNLAVEVTKQEQITEQTPIGKGGESNVYPYKDYFVAKVFKPEAVDLSLKTIVLARVMRKERTLHTISKRYRKEFEYVVPRKLLLDEESQQMFAYTMKRVDGMPLANLVDKKEREKLGFTRKEMLEILINMGEGIEILHQQGIYIGDLSGRNILFDQSKKVYFIEFDAVGIDEIRAFSWTDTYIDPKSIGNITMKDDWYSFAIQAFHCLTNVHPFNGIYFLEEDGKEKELETEEKMERRISLLGPHGIKPPVMAEDWSWMSKSLLTAFLETFEGEVRISLVPYLKNEYKRLYGGGIEKLKSEILQIPCKIANKEIRLNPKFIAKKVSPFPAPVVRVINQYTAVCQEGSEEFVIVLTGEGSQRASYQLELARTKKVQDVLLNQSQEVAWIIYPSQIMAVRLSSAKVIYEEDIFLPCWATVNENTLHFATSLAGEYILCQRTLQPNGVVKKEQIRFLPLQPTKALEVKNNSKFVLVKSQDDNDIVYCNDQMMYAMPTSRPNNKYNILYDSASSSWLVIASEGKGVVITKIGSLREIDLNRYVDDGFLVGNISYYQKTIYIPMQGQLHMIKVADDQIVAKEMECHEIMTPESKLYDINREGFSIITDNILYEVRKG